MFQSLTAGPKPFLNVKIMVYEPTEWNKELNFQDQKATREVILPS